MKTSLKTLSLLAVTVTAASLLSCHVLLDPPEPLAGEMRLNKNHLSLDLGQIDTLKLTLDPPDLQQNSVITWSYDPSSIVLDYDNYGAVVTALKSGDTVITARTGTISTSCSVSISGNPLARHITNPYVYSTTEYVSLTPGETRRVSASLFGGTNSDSSGYSFTIDKPSVAALVYESNYAWITGTGSGVAKVTIRHNKSAYNYTFLVSCQADSTIVPYLTTETNIITLDKNKNPELSCSVDLVHSDDPSSETGISYSIIDPSGAVMTFPPISLLTNGRHLVITAREAGECHIAVSHPSAPYPLTILVRIVEELENIFIEPSSPVVYVSGNSSQLATALLVNVPPAVEIDQAFNWTFDSGYENYIDVLLYGTGIQGSNDTLWINGKKSGAVKATISHPLAVASVSMYIIVKDITEEAARASTYISTSQNYIQTHAGGDPLSVSIYLNNAVPGDEADVHWSILNEALDNRADPVISWEYGTGSSSSSSRNARSASDASAYHIITGNAVIAPLKPGKATITISHPKSVYDTIIIVSVREHDTLFEDSLFTLSTTTPSVNLKNGFSTSLDIVLTGNACQPGDEYNLLWSCSPHLSITPNGASVMVEAAGETLSTEYITVNHINAKTPLSIPVVIYNEASELDSYKYLAARDPYRLLSSGETATLTLFTQNILAADRVLWNASDDALVFISQLSKTSVSVTARNRGVAVITASLNDDSQVASFYLTITAQEETASPPLPSYLTTMQNVVILTAEEQKSVYITPINIPADKYSTIDWSNSNSAALEVISNGDSALFRARTGSGKATVTVSSPYSANTLDIHVHIGTEYEYKNTDYPYISTPSDTLTLTLGSPDTLFQTVLAHTASSELETSGFSFSILNPSVASIVSSGNTVFLTPVSTGHTTLRITHPRAIYDKEVTVFVEKEGGASAPVPYLTTATNVVTVIAGETVAATVSLADYSGQSAVSFAWQSENPQIANPIAHTGATAMIRGHNPGTTYINVSNTKAANTLKLIVICIDAASVQSRPWIHTTTNILTIHVNGTGVVTAEMIGGSASDNESFIWSISDGTVAMIQGSGQTVPIRGLKEGMSYLTIRNSAYSDSYLKSVLVVVDKKIVSDTYITVSDSIVTLKPDTSSIFTVKANLVNGTVTDPQNFVFWADDYKLIYLDSLTDTAQIRSLGPSGITSVHVKHPKASEVIDILVIISNYDTFRFSTPSTTVKQGQIYFIPMQVPPSVEDLTVTYSSYNDDVCTVTGSSQVAMIAGVSAGQTTIKAELSNASGSVIATAELAVIVSYQDPNAATLTTSTTILTLSDGESKLVQASLSGRGILAGDTNNISWSSGDPAVLALFTSGTNEIKGTSAYITAHNPTKSTVEAVLTVTHPKCESALTIWVVIPGSLDRSIILDQTSIEMYKDDGAVSITATLVNAASNDYNNISWSAPKSGGSTIVSITRSKGRSCNVVPRSPGQTTLRAQLPNGVFADCIIIVKSSAHIIFESTNVHVNPGFSETIAYSVIPENANINWLSAFNTGSPGTTVFDYRVNTTNKTVTITGVDIGTGTVSAYFTGVNGGATVALQVFVEYTYELTLQTASTFTYAEPRGQTITIPFTVYPHLMEVDAAVSPANEHKVLIKTISLDTRTGEGKVEVVPLRKGTNIDVTVTARNPNDPVHGTVSRKHTFNFYYQEVHFIPEFNFAAGSFTYFNPLEGPSGTLHLGDGETQTFTVRALEENADIQDLSITWNPNSINAHARSYTSLSPDLSNPSSLWRITHSTDVVEQGYYVVKYELNAGVEITPIQNVAGEGESLAHDPTFYYGSLSSYSSIVSDMANFISYPIPSGGFTSGKKFYVPFMGKDGAFSNDDGSLSNDNLNVFNNFCISLGHDPAQFLANDKYGVRVRLLFTYTLCTPYKIPRQNFKNYLPASYQQAGGYLYDTGLFDSAADDDPTIDSRYTGTIEISYRQAARGITKIYSIPVAIEIRSCPAYMKP